ncbi:hypothetical protein ACFXG4_37805 [Nocardia sp. NPDC059246]|uniref:hypothetical protein n=1 Tax=unclassified Nocardia TaxID=2637762 RepID=UPI0036AA5DF5
MTGAAGAQVPADMSTTYAVPLRHMEPTWFAKASDHLASERSRTTPKPRIALGSVCPPDAEAIHDEGPRGASNPSTR